MRGCLSVHVIPQVGMAKLLRELIYDHGCMEKWKRSMNMSIISYSSAIHSID